MKRMHRLLKGEMKQSWIMAACAVLAMTIISCGPTLWTAHKWLRTQEMAQPQIDITGRWDSSESVGGSWGPGSFKQDGARFSGILGGYKVEGAISGKEACLVLEGSSWTNSFYTARVTLREDGRLVGIALSGKIVGPLEGPFRTDSYSLILKKEKD